jgi:hypothetical protein
MTRTSGLSGLAEGGSLPHHKGAGRDAGATVRPEATSTGLTPGYKAYAVQTGDTAGVESANSPSMSNRSAFV